MRKSQPQNYTAFVCSLHQYLWIRNRLRPNKQEYVAYEMCMRGCLPTRMIYKVAKHVVRHFIMFGELSRHS